MAGDAGGDVEAVDVGELHVQEHELRLEATGLGDRARAVHRLADDVEPLRLQQHARARPKGRVVVDDQDGAVHRVDSRHRANPFTYGWPYNTSSWTFYRSTAAEMALTASAGSCGAEYGGPGDEHRGARRRRSGAAVSASIPPSTSSAGVVADQLAQALELADRGLQERLAAPAGVDRHAQDHVGLDAR